MSLDSSFKVLWTILLLISFSNVSPQTINDLQSYIIQVKLPPKVTKQTSFSTSSRDNWYKSFLPTALASSLRRESRLIYSYNGIVDGFAARLTSEELDQLKNKSGFIHAYPDRLLPLQTTYSPAFLGLKQNSGLWRSSNFGQGVVIGMLDTGITPDHPSFSSRGMPEPPEKWKGSCEFDTFVCNNKIIGAKTFMRSINWFRKRSDKAGKVAGRLGPYDSRLGPYDDDGHGTHTASTAAGALVANASVNGQAKGTAAGVAPLAHLAIYKVCGEEGCFQSDMLAGMEAAVEDGVDIISLSIANGADILGGTSIFYNDAIAIGAFNAVAKGVFVSAAAGNDGPNYYTLSNAAPWILTVGAGSTDRSMRTVVKLRNKTNKTVLNGESAFQPSARITTSFLPLIYPGYIDTFCSNFTLSEFDVRGKIVVCDDGNVEREVKGENVKRAGGAAMIIVNYDTEGHTLPAVPHVLPASHIGYEDGVKLKAYIRASKNPKAAIDFKGTVYGKSPAPTVACFSSRGPSLNDPTILKPDIIDPGSNILAAWSSNIGTEPPTKFNIISGTSMSTPHLSGIVALLKNTHPDWSPAAIKSAIMTTASIYAKNGNLILDQNLTTADFLATGSGHVDPTKASNPGPIYDINPNDYIAHLCGLGYSDRKVRLIANHQLTTNCKSIRKNLSSDLNYPSFMITLSLANFYNVTSVRLVTNVGAATSAYKVRVKHPKWVNMRVNPKRIVFNKVNQKARYTVTFTGRGNPTKGSNIAQGYLTWVSTDNSVTVNSPILVMLSWLAFIFISVHITFHFIVNNNRYRRLVME